MLFHPTSTWLIIFVAMEQMSFLVKKLFFEPVNAAGSTPEVFNLLLFLSKSADSELFFPDHRIPKESKTLLDRTTDSKA